MEEKAILNYKEINKLILKAQEGDIEARNKVIDNNYGLVASIAKNFTTNTTMSFEDMFQEGVIGLVKAIERFDVSKGYRFPTYATWWVKQSIQRSLADNSKSIRLPIHIQEQLSRLKKAQKHLTQDLDMEPTIEEIYNEINIDMGYFDKIVNHEFYEELVKACNLNNPDAITEVQAIIMEDMDFDENAELVCKQIISDLKRGANVSYDSVNLKINISKKRISQLLRHNAPISSLDIPANDDMDTDIVANISSGKTVDDIYNDKMIVEGLTRAIDEVYGTEKDEFRQRIVKEQTELKKELITLNETKNEVKELTELVKLLKADKDKVDELKKAKDDLAKASKKLIRTKNSIKKLKEQIPKLLEREKRFIDKAELIKRRYGLCGYKKETLQELGERFNVSRERVRQIEKQIISGKHHYDKNTLLKKKIIKYCNLSAEEVGL